MTVTTEPVAPVASRLPGDPRVTFPRLVRSEAIKLFTLRSTWWSLAIAAGLSVGMSTLIASATSGGEMAVPAINAVLLPTQFTMLVVAILGAIAASGEYSTGMIRSTLTAQPRRGNVLVAKAVVVAVAVAITIVVTYAITIAVTAPLVGSPIEWSDPDASVVPLAFGVFSMVCFALLGVGFGFLIRNGAGSIAATVGVLFVLPLVFALFAVFNDDWRWLTDLAQYLPTNASATLSATGDDVDRWPALAAMLAWVAGPLLAGYAVLRGRDA
jgi:ABC-2 type transport system permease protein